MTQTKLFLSTLVIATLLTSFGGTQRGDTGQSTTSGEVKIGDQTWMSENLNVDKFRNGDPIPEVRSRAEWAKASDDKQPAWCYYENMGLNGAKYGKLYNWYAVNDPRGLAPTGWHIPSDAEWARLINYFGIDDHDAGTRMKSTSGWAENGNGTNESGFSGLPGGYRSSLGDFGLVGGEGVWWSSTEDRTHFAWSRFLTYEYDFVERFNHSKGAGLSVRCLRY